MPHNFALIQSSFKSASLEQSNLNYIKIGVFIRLNLIWPLKAYPIDDFLFGALHLFKIIQGELNYCGILRILLKLKKIILVCKFETFTNIFFGGVG